MKLIRNITFMVRIACHAIIKLYNTMVFYANKVQYQKDLLIHGKICISNLGEIIIGRNFQANSGGKYNPIGGDTILRFIVKKNGKLKIGNNVGISNSTIVCWHNVDIRDYVYIGGGCRIWDTDFHSLDPVERRHNGDTKVKTAPIIIDEYAFIGGGTIVLKGVRIGKNAVIAAGSVVTKSVPDNEVWGGNPARRLKNLLETSMMISF